MDETVDTGLVQAANDPTAIREGSEPVTVTVTMPEVVPVITPEAREAAKILLQLPKDLDTHKLATLAREIAMDIKEVSTVLKTYGLTESQYEFVKENPFFKRMLENEIITWNSSLSTHDRIRIEAAAILEDNLPTLGARMVKAGEGLPGVVEAGKLFAKIAGLETPDKAAAAPGEKFRITINLGSDVVVKHQTKDISPAARTIEGSATEVRADSKGESSI